MSDNPIPNMTVEQAMNFVALDKAAGFWGPGAAQNPALVLETAEKFRAFLAGGYPKPEPVTVKDERPVFRLPRKGDGYVYFSFQDSYFLYRSHAANGALVQSADRMSALHDVDWEAATGSLRTRRGLRDANGYNEISAERAAHIIREYVKGVRFE